MSNNRFPNGNQRAEELRLTPGTTFKLTQATTNVVDSFAAAEYTLAGDSANSKNKAVAAIIDVHVNDVIIGFSNSALALSSDLGHLRGEGTIITLQSQEEVEQFQFINSVTDEVVELMVTFYFRKQSA